MSQGSASHPSLKPRWNPAIVFWICSHMCTLWGTFPHTPTSRPASWPAVEKKDRGKSKMDVHLFENTQSFSDRMTLSTVTCLPRACDVVSSYHEVTPVCLLLPFPFSCGCSNFLHFSNCEWAAYSWLLHFYLAWQPLPFKRQSITRHRKPAGESLAVYNLSSKLWQLFFIINSGDLESPRRRTSGASMKCLQRGFTKGKGDLNVSSIIP